VVNQSLGDSLRCLVGENLSTWDLVLPITKFAYNSYVNRSIGLSLFEVVVVNVENLHIFFPFP